MTDHIRLFSDPTKLACNLSLHGPVEPFRVGKQYQGTLTFAGNHGDVSVVDWDGDLPAGSTVTVDQDHQHIVILWPAFEEIPAHEVTVDAANMDFEEGDEGWDKGEGIDILIQETDPSKVSGGRKWTATKRSNPSSVWFARYANNSGQVEIVNRVFVPIGHSPIRASVNVQQGAGDVWQEGGAVMLKWYDRNKLHLGNSVGDFVWDGRRGNWSRSYVEAVPPDRAVYVKLAAVCARNRQNLPMWLDDFTWDGAFTYMADASKIGHDNEDPIHLSITIRDARGCRATWSGVIRDYAVYLTSQLYGLYVEEGELDAPLVTGGSVLGLREGSLQQDDADSPLVSGGSVVALSLSRTVDYTTYDWLQDDADSPLVTGGSVVTLSMEQNTEYSTYDHAQDDTDSPVVTGGSVLTLDMEVTTGYQKYSWPQEDDDSPIVTGGSITNLTMTRA